MDIKETNNNSVVQQFLAFAKMGPGAMVESSGFAELVNGSDSKEEFTAAPVSNAKKEVVRNPKETAVDLSVKPNADKARGHEEPVEKEDVKKVADNEAPAEEKVSEKPADEEENFAYAQPAANQDAAVQKEEAAAKPAVAAAVEAVVEGVPAPVVADVAAPREIYYMNPVTKELFTVEDGVLVKADIPQTKVLPEQIILLKGEQNVETAKINPNNKDRVQEVAEDILAPELNLEDTPILEASDELNSVFKPAEASANVKAEEVEASTLDGKFVSEELAGQSAEIAKVIGEDKKVKIEVSVETDKPEQFSFKGLLSDAVAVDEAVSALESGDSETIIASQNQTRTQTPQTAVGLGVVQAQITPLAEQDFAAVKPEFAAKDSSVISSQNTLQGGEVLANAKAQTASETPKTSFKDIYKGMSKEVIDQIKVNITKSAVKGIDKIDIQLKPQDLGSVEVKLHIGKDGKLQAQVLTSRPETLELLQKDAQSLEKALNDAGFDTNSSGLSFGLKEEQSNRENDNLRDFLSKALSEDNEIENMDFVFDNAWDGKSALNIRV